MPFKLDITQILVEYKRFDRSGLWWEYHYGKEQDYKDPIFKTLKTNLPKNHSIPDGLKVFLKSVKSDFMDPRNRNSIQCNIPQDEILALKELQELQRKRFFFKPCDKGVGLIIVDFEDYIKSCYEHLTSKTIRWPSLLH